MRHFDKDKRIKLLYPLRLVVCLLLFCMTEVGGTKNIASGMEYKQYITDAQQVIHVLSINPKNYILKSVHANHSVHGLETVASIAKKENAIAGINGSFFRMGEKVDGLPAGILKIDGRWFGVAYRAHGALGWSYHQNRETDQSDANVSQKNSTLGLTVLMDRLQTRSSLELNGTKFPVHGLNQPGSAKRAILYTDAYGDKADSLVGGTDVVIQDNEIKAVVVGSPGNTKIPPGGYVYAIGKEVKASNGALFVGAKTKLQIKVNPSIQKSESENWQNMDNIVGGIPLLIESGRILPEFGQEHMLDFFVKKQYARTAVGILPSGNWVFAVVEKSQASGSPGMTLSELSYFMQNLGCHLALNLDGGGSSTLYLEGKVVNNPENELDENIILPMARPIADAILVIPKDNVLVK